jgi:hypothetical protein
MSGHLEIRVRVNENTRVLLVLVSHYVIGKTRDLRELFTWVTGRKPNQPHTGTLRSGIKSIATLVSGRREVPADIVRMNKRTVVVRLSDGNVVKRKLDRDIP